MLKLNRYLYVRPKGGRVTLARSKHMHSQLITAFQENPCDVMIDLIHLADINDTQALFLMQYARMIQLAKKRLYIINVSSRLMKHLARLGLTTIVDCAPKSEPPSEIPPLADDVVPIQSTTMRVDGSSMQIVRTKIDTALRTTSLSEQERFDVTLAAGEAMGNMVLHTPEQYGHITLEIYQDRVVLEAVDNGEGFSLADGELPQETLTHGRGIKLMRMLVDNVQISRKYTEPGTRVVLTKLFNEQASYPASVV